MPTDLHTVRLNNGVRQAIDAALGGLQLFAPDRGDAGRRCGGGVQGA